MNKYTNTYINELSEKTAFAGAALGALGRSLVKPVSAKAVGGLAATGLGTAGLYQQLTGQDTMLGKARDFMYNAAGAASPTDKARNEIMGMEQNRLNQRQDAIKAGLPVLGSSTNTGKLKAPTGAVSFFGGGSGENLVEGAKEKVNEQNAAALRAATNPSANSFLSKAVGESPKMKTQDGMVEVRRAEAVKPSAAATQAAATQAPQAAGPSDAFLAKVMGSYNRNSIADRRRADIVRTIMKENPNATPNQIYADKRYIQDYKNFKNRNRR